MVDEGMLQEAVGRVVGAAHSPRQVILFGSHARGTADRNSDLDLLVIEKRIGDAAAEYLRLREALGRLPVGVDLLLVGEDDFERRSRVPGTLHYRARREGRILYDAGA